MNAGNIYTAAQQAQGIASGDAFVQPVPPSIGHINQLSGYAGCNLDDEQSGYAARRMFDNINLSQSYGNEDAAGPVWIKGKMGGNYAFVNPSRSLAVVQGRGTKHGSSDAMTEDKWGTQDLQPFRAFGGMAGGIRPEYLIGTVSEGLTMPEKAETQNVRPYLPSDMPSSYNIVPMSEYALCRQQNVCRLNTIRTNSIASQLKAFNSGDF